MTARLLTAALLLAGCSGENTDLPRPAEASPAVRAPDRGCPAGTPDLVEGFLTAAVDVDSATLVVLAAGSAAGTTTWRLDLRTDTWQRQPATGPYLGMADAVYDPRTDAVLAWSGRDRRLVAYDLDGDKWTPLAAGPDRMLGDPVYEPRTGRTILRDPASGTLWAYDPSAGSWGRIPGSRGPGDQIAGSDRYYSFMVADPGRHQLILVQTSLVRPGSTWRFDLARHRWSRMDAVPPEMNAGWDESGSEMVLDEASGKIFLFSDGVLAAFDPATSQWRDIDLAEPLVSEPSGELQLSTGPLARLGHTLVYDPDNARMLVVGGQYRTDDSGADGNVWRVACEVWSYETSSDRWTEVATTP